MKYKLFVFVYCAFFFLSGCIESEQEQDSGGSIETNIRIYNSQVGEQNEIVESDTIKLKLRNNYKLYVESNYDSISVIYDEQDMLVEQIDSDMYLCKPRSADAIDIIFLGYNRETGTKILSVREVHFKISGYYENYYIIENSYTVEVVNSEVTKYKILQDLENSLLQEGHVLHLYYAGLSKGEFSYLGSDISGNFVLEETDCILTYDNLELAVTISQMEDGYYKMEQNLTEKYKLLYPLKEVEKVSLISVAAKTGDNG